MHILMITASLPYPPHQGGALRSYGILHGLHEAGHQITLLSFHDSENGIAAESTPLNDYCSRIETLPPPNRSKTDRLRDLLFSSQPDIQRRLYSEDFYECLKALHRETPFDLIQFEGIEVAAYLPLLRRDGVKAKLCYDAFNAEAALQQVIAQVDRGNIRRWPAAAYSMIQTRRITRFERELCQQADCVIAVSDEDAALLQQYREDKRVAVVTNGIFVDDYAETSEQLDLGEHTLVFTGKMDYRPNVDAMMWFADDVLPLIQAQIPDTRLYVVGQKPHPRLEKLRHKNNIEITGWVRDVQPFLRGASVYVAPLRMGSGTRLKILEAMASGCAVVATSIAISGMQAQVRDAVIVADEAERMAQAITSLLQDSDKRAAMGKAAQHFVRQAYDWPVLIPNLLAAYREIGLE
jgi:glycosyltransferase involved in cell wall biosynthesis